MSKSEYVGDPLISTRTTYDPEMRFTEHGSRIYSYWKKVRRNTDYPEFTKFPVFLNWAMSNGYTLGAKLFRRDNAKPFTPENCYWLSSAEWRGKDHGDGETLTYNLKWMRKWDETVNRIREHFGMEPIYSEEV